MDMIFCSQPHPSILIQTQLIGMSTRNREWESSISSSPITHRFVKRPLSHLRRKTESLLSDITGANVTQDEQLKDKELGKRSTCRHCDVRFHDEMALSTVSKW